MNGLWGFALVLAVDLLLALMWMYTFGLLQRAERRAAELQKENLAQQELIRKMEANAQTREEVLERALQMLYAQVDTYHTHISQN